MTEMLTEETKKDIVMDEILICTTLDEDMISADMHQTKMSKIRDDVIVKLTTLVGNTDFQSPPEKMGDVAARMQPVTTLLGAIKEQEKSFQNRVKVKINKKDLDNDEATSEIITAFLKSNPTNRILSEIEDHDQISNDLSNAVDTSDTPIQEYELRDDPNDLS